jgi:hypothetical protein
MQALEQATFSVDKEINNQMFRYTHNLSANPLMKRFLRNVKIEVDSIREVVWIHCEDTAFGALAYNKLPEIWDYIGKAEQELIFPNRLICSYCVLVKRGASSYKLRGGSRCDRLMADLP